MQYYFILNYKPKETGVETKQLIKELIDKIEDIKFDPEPQYDEILSNIPIHQREQLLHHLKMLTVNNQ